MGRVGVGVLYEKVDYLLLCQTQDDFQHCPFQVVVADHVVSINPQKNFLRF